jgi:hypothetical protein
MMKQDRCRGQRGQTLPVIGFCFMLIMAFSALAVDMGYLDWQHMRMQNATDDAALKGAQALIPNSCPNQTAANTAAQADAALDGFPAGSQINVTVHNPPQTNDGPYAGVNCAVSVEINVPQTTTFFLKLFGFSSGMPITTQAVALMEDNNPGCIFLLNPSIVSTFTGAKISASGCGLLMNDTATDSSASLGFSEIGYAGSSALTSGATYPNATPTPMLPAADPCAEITGCAYIAANPPSTSSCTTLSQTGGSISPGCYSSLTLSGAVTLNPGTYALTGTTYLSGLTSLTGTGVTFYVASTATAPNFGVAAGSASPGSLSAPTSGNYANVLYYQVPANTTNPTFGVAGGLVNLTGLIYASGATNALYCCTTGAVVLVFGGATFASISGEASPPPNAVTIPTSSPFIANAVLVQ